MSLFDRLAADERFTCAKCGRLVPDVQTKAAMGQGHMFIINELAAFMALYADGDSPLLYGYCEHCHRMNWWELPEVEVRRTNSPYEDLEITNDDPSRV